jgi:intracellular multiplication protein IcmK
MPMPSPGVVRPDLVNESVEQIAPLTREEIVRLRRELEERSRGMTENVTGRPAPRPSAQVFQLDLSPTAAVAPPVVRVTPGQGAVISFLDSTGAPWPIELADNAAADGGIVVQRFTAHQLSVFVRTRTALGNVLVALKGLPTAVSFTVVSGQEATDYQVHLVVPRFLNGPPTNVLSSSSVPALGTADLFDYLLRTPPQGAKPLKIEGLPGAAAWQTGPTKMVVRTDAQLTEALRHFSLDGTGVYEVRLSPLVLGTFNGRFVELKVSGF